MKYLPVDFLSLEDLPIDTSTKELAELCAPFVMKEVSGNDREWNAALAKRRRKIGWRYLRQRLFGWLPQRRRVEGNIKKQYAAVWTDIEFSSYDPTLRTPPINLWVWGQRRLFARVRVGARIRQYLLIKLLRSLKPRRVLEVGSGNGVNLLLLAGQFPEIEFHGIELTEQGVAAARDIQARDAIPENFTAFAPSPLKDRGAFKRVSFWKGSAGRMPFADGEFDLVYTCVAVEQMERIREQALREISRVSGEHVFFYEPFYDVNRSGLARRYIVARDYFRGTVGDLNKYALEPVWATNDLPQKVNNNICAVYCRKKGGSA